MRKANALAKTSGDLDAVPSIQLSPFIVITDESDSRFAKMGKTSRNEDLAPARLDAQRPQLDLLGCSRECPAAPVRRPRPTVSAAWIVARRFHRPSSWNSSRARLRGVTHMYLSEI